VKKEIASFKINGRSYDVIITPNMTLYELLKEQLDITGTKHSCGVGQCGSCTVLVGGNPILACSTLAIAVRDKEILTIEGLAKGAQLHPLQQAFVDKGAIQCGFCTPGMIMMAKALLDGNPEPTRQEVREGLGGNLCRCTGYVKIIDAVLAAAEAMRKEGNP
jgi:aerobic carbon-monoxide dehydrogenase small subunit